MYVHGTEVFPRRRERRAACAEAALSNGLSFADETLALSPAAENTRCTPDIGASTGADQMASETLEDCAVRTRAPEHRAIDAEDGQPPSRWRMWCSRMLRT